MSISKHLKNGKMTYQVFVKVRDSSGKQVSLKRSKLNSEKEAKRVEFELLTLLQGHKSKITWESWVNRCLERYKVEYLYSTYRNYKLNLEKWINPALDKKFIDEITPSDIHKLVFEGMEPLSSYSRRGIIKIVKRIFNLALEEGIILRNPALGIRVRVAESNQAVLNKNEIETFLEQAKILNHRYYHHWTLALLTGMRSGELHALKWTDIDFVTGVISITKAWTKLNGLGSTKTSKNRAFPISKECAKFLHELRSLYPKEEFVLPRDKEWEQGLIAGVTKDFCLGIGITPVKFHDLRATFITQMLTNGVALAKVMSIVGHSSLKTTQGYLRLSGKDVEGATEELKIFIPETKSTANVLEFKRGL
ncbi:MAG: site-specific integrase [Bdellovibrionales bacterium]|nr:site-specific integrase [Bdellovibrionales bacterium]